MNRHEVVSLLTIAAATLFAIGTTVVLMGAFLAPGTTRDLVGEVGIVVTALAWFGWAFATILFRDRIVEWLRRRAALRGQP